MLQRIQSIFLALASLLTFGLFGADFAETPGPAAASEVFSADGEFDVYDSIILMGGVLAAGLILLVAIFLYGNRRLQVVLCNVGIFLTAAYLIYAILVWATDPAAEQTYVDFGLALPLLAIILTVFAGTYIKKDERLVRSADRLR